MIGLLLSGIVGGIGTVLGTEVGQWTWDKFSREHPEEAKALSRNIIEPYIRSVQTMLFVLGEDIDITGEPDEQTEAAVRIFQAKAGLDMIDGNPGRKTMRALTAKMLERFGGERQGGESEK